MTVNELIGHQYAPRKNLVYALAKWFNSIEPEVRLIMIENFNDWRDTVPPRFRDVVWQAMTTDINKIPEFVYQEISVCKAG